MSARLKPEYVRSVLKTSGTVCIILAIGILIGYLLLVLSYLVPPAMQQDESWESVSVFREEGKYPLDPNSGFLLDNFTDSIMLQVANYSGTENAFEKAVCSYFSRIYEDNPVLSFIELNENTDAPADRISYARYWHGYQLVLRPLLTMFNYRQIRNINLIAQSILLGAILVLLGRKMPVYLAPFILFVMFLAPSAIYQCLQFSSVYYIVLISIIILMLFYGKLKSLWHGQAFLYLFVLIGMATSYLDLLTSPTVSLTVPLCFLYLLRRNDDSVDSPNRLLIVCIVFWFVGYAGMWAGKWVLAFAYQGFDYLQSLFLKIAFRLSTDSSGYVAARLPTLLKNIKQLFINPTLTAITGAYAAILIGTGLKSRLKLRQFVSDALPIALLCAIPIFWLVMLSNHSSIHFWFTYRSLAPCIFILLSSLCNPASRGANALRKPVT